MWTIKVTYQSPPGQDVLVSQFLGGENILQLAGLLYNSDPSPILGINVYITDSRDQAEFFIYWASQTDYDTWYAVHKEECDQLVEDARAYGASQGVTYTRSQPPHEDYDWSNEVPIEQLYPVDDVFLYLSNATL